jgi:tRNA threonylcarbamoyl adenosine modification protein (Sua5/YciO/YrdC/YwlC family)
MTAPVYSVEPDHPSAKRVTAAVQALEAGGLIAYPTDTYYGIGCDLFSKKAIERLYLLKGRDRKKPLSIICPDLSEVASYARVSNFAYRTMRHLAPGPFTFVLPATRSVPEMMTTRQKQVGIRIPNSALAVALARGLGRPVVNTSAADRQGKPLTDAIEIRDVLGHGLAMILDGGVRKSEASTVISLVDDAIEILRPGKGEVPGQHPDRARK